jgi:hypothetical protein
MAAQFEVSVQHRFEHGSLNPLRCMLFTKLPNDDTTKKLLGLKQDTLPTIMTAFQNGVYGTAFYLYDNATDCAEQRGVDDTDRISERVMYLVYAHMGRIHDTGGQRRTFTNPRVPPPDCGGVRGWRDATTRGTVFGCFEGSDVLFAYRIQYE